MTLAYTAGTILLTNGSKTVTGTGTGWQTALIAGGVIYPDAAGNALPVETVNSNTGITAAVAWKGATGTYSYAIIRDTAYLQQLSANAQALATYISRLDSASLGALAALASTLGAGKVPRGLSGTTMEWMTVSDDAKAFNGGANFAAMRTALGAANVAGQVFSGEVAVDRPANAHAYASFYSAGFRRWNIGRLADTHNFFIDRFTAAGGFLARSLEIGVDTGHVKLANQPMCRATTLGNDRTLVDGTSYGLLPANGAFLLNRGGFYAGGAVGGYPVVHVPADGVYLVTMNIARVTSAPGRRVHLLRNDSTVVLTTMGGATATDESRSVQALVQCVAGDYFVMRPQFGNVVAYFAAAHTEVSIAFLG